MRKSYLVAIAAATLLLAPGLFAQTPVYYEEFDEGMGTWWIGFESGQAEGTSMIDETEDWLSGSNSLAIVIDEGGSSNWHVQVLDHISQLDSGTTYDVYFLSTVDAEEAINLALVWSLPVDPWTNFKTFNVQLEPEAKRYGPYTWLCSSSADEIDLKFWLGNNGSVIVWIDSIVVVEAPTTGICPNKGAATPDEFNLAQNYPNPFNPVTKIRYNLPEQSQVAITIYDVLGREIRRLVNTTQDAGFNSIIWDGTDDAGQSVGAGLYLYRIQAGEYAKTNKMILLK